MTVLKILTRASVQALERFLARKPESSLVLLSNARTAGLEDRGHLFEGTYAAFTEGEEITGVAALYWNGLAFLQSPVQAADLVRAAMTASGRDLAGLAGPWEQVQEAAGDLGIPPRSCVKNGREVLFSLSLGSLKIPGPLRDGTVICRHPQDEELPVLVGWRLSYCRECLITGAGETIGRDTCSLIRRLQEDRNHWVLENEGRIVATSAFNATLPDMVQVGGVYTPPEFRNRGYARSVVAGSLLEAAQRGAARAVLFTGTDMAAAQRAYTALGFTRIGEYGLLILKK